MLLFPNAKINIGLYVTKKRPDGYHDLETVFYPIPLCDTIELRELRSDLHPFEFITAGTAIMCPPAENLVVRVFTDLKKEFDLPALEIYLDKKVPMGAGLGGGSSDAAAMMLALNEMYKLGLSADEMERRISTYGADCAFFIRQRPAFATGIGDVLTPFSLSLKGLTLVLVKPNIFVSTREAYAGVSPTPAPCHLPDVLQQPVNTWRDVVSNDFEKSVLKLHPAIASIKQTLYDMGALYASMSGSGSTVFALFDRPVEEARTVFEDCFVFTALLRQ